MARRIRYSHTSLGTHTHREKRELLCNPRCDRPRASAGRSGSCPSPFPVCVVRWSDGRRVLRPGRLPPVSLLTLE